jgi:hypothetical protein
MDQSLRTCPLCQSEKPELDKNGRHNFSPHIVEGQVVNICVHCKSVLDKALHNRDQYSSPSH